MRAGICDQNSPKKKGWPQAGVFRYGGLATENRDSRSCKLAMAMRLLKQGGGDREDLQWIGQCLHLCQAGIVSVIYLSNICSL